jgi:hypothetical protein
MERTDEWQQVETEVTHEPRGMSTTNHIRLRGVDIRYRRRQIKVIHAGWLRDPETWPEGAVAPESDEALTGNIHNPNSPNAVAKFTTDNDRSDKQRTKIKDDGHLVPIHEESSSLSPP